MPKGHGSQQMFRLRPWQLDWVASIFDRPKRPRIAGLMIGRANGKSTLAAALGLWNFFCGGQGATVVIVAVSKDQAGIIYRAARRMVELSPALASRCQIGRDRLYLPRTDATLECLPADPKALEGLDYTLALLDEAGVVDRATYEVLVLAQGKREVSSLIAIGTPGPDPTDSVLTDLRNMHAELGDDYVAWREFSADAFQHHDVTCRHCWELANPALGDFQADDAMVRLVTST